MKDQPIESGSHIYRMWAFLSGCTQGVEYSSKEAANKAIIQLATCEEHHGIHHFAVICEGQGIAFSPTGKDCLRKAGLL